MKTATSVSSLSSQANSPATPNSGIHPQARLSLNENVETLRRWPDEKNKNIYHTFKEEPPGVCFFFFFDYGNVCANLFFMHVWKTFSSSVPRCANRRIPSNMYPT